MSEPYRLPVWFDVFYDKYILILSGSVWSSQWLVSKHVGMCAWSVVIQSWFDLFVWTANEMDLRNRRVSAPLKAPVVILKCILDFIKTNAQNVSLCVHVVGTFLFVHVQCMNIKKQWKSCCRATNLAMCTNNHFNAPTTRTTYFFLHLQSSSQRLYKLYNVQTMCNVQHFMTKE